MKRGITSLLLLVCRYLLLVDGGLYREKEKNIVENKKER